MAPSPSEYPSAKIASSRPEQFDPAELAFRELFTVSMVWILFWTVIATLGWVAYELIGLFLDTNTNSDHLAALIGGAVLAFVAAISALMLSERPNSLAAGIMKTISRTSRRYVFPLTLVFGALIGASWGRHSVDPKPARYITVACARMLSCTQEAVRLSAGEVDVEGYLIETAK